MNPHRTQGEAVNVDNDPLAVLRAKIEAAKAVKIQLSPEQTEKAKLLQQLSEEADRAKAEQAARDNFLRQEALFDARLRLPDTLLDSTVIDGVGPVVVRAPNGGEVRAYKEAVRKGKSADAAEQTFALACVEHPSREECKRHFANYPFMVSTIADMASKLGGLQGEADRKSG